MSADLRARFNLNLFCLGGRQEAKSVLPKHQDGGGTAGSDVSGVYHGIGIPAGAPKEVRDFLVEALKRVITSDEFIQRMEKMSYEPIYMDPQQYSAFWSEYESWGQKVGRDRQTEGKYTGEDIQNDKEL